MWKQPNLTEHDFRFTGLPARDSCAVVDVCGERCPSVCCSDCLARWLLSLWLRFDYNKHLTLFQSNTWHVAAPKGILDGSVVFNFPITLPITAYVHLCMCNVCLCGCVCIHFGQRLSSWVYFRHVWVVVCVTVAESESRKDNVWMPHCISSCAFGAVIVCMSSTLWSLSFSGLICLITEEKLDFSNTFKPNQSPYLQGSTFQT